MLADSAEWTSGAGSFSDGLHKPDTFRHAVLDFIFDALPHWRDDPERPRCENESELTEFLSNFLNGEARRADGLDVLQFTTEATDTQKKNRKIDITPKPLAETIWIGQKAYSRYESIIPIECKRLPTPKGSKRDTREYVFNRHTSTGGIHRFKAGDHGAAFNLGAMIGYVQKKQISSWHTQVNGWIAELSTSNISVWSESDQLRPVRVDNTRRSAVFVSTHQRENSSPIELRHLWVEMLGTP